MKLDFLRRLCLLPFAADYVLMPGRSHRGPYPALTAIEQEIELRCRTHVANLAATERFTALQLQAAANYLESALSSSGYAVERSPIAVRDFEVDNLIAALPGSSPDVFIVGAHYDTVAGSAGANDNASGLAAMLELARLASHWQPRPTLRFVAFANEEHVGLPPESMGSFLYAQQCLRRKEAVRMWSLETLGYYCQQASSQSYPRPFDLFYPTVGNFLAFVGNHHCRSFVRHCTGLFRKQGGFPAEGVASPDKFRDVMRSDHWGFLQCAYPALMITDTANFRYRHYHTEDDTPDKVCYDRLAQVISRLSAVLAALVLS